MSSMSVDECIAFLHGQGIHVGPTEPPKNTVRSLCEGLNGAYSLGLHCGACCVILVASSLGCAIPIITKYVQFLRSHPFIFIVGKTAATGVLLSVATIHLIHEGTTAFSEPCIIPFFKEYSAFSFLFALIAVLLMQALDLKLAEVAEGWVRAKHNIASQEDNVNNDDNANNGSYDDVTQGQCEPSATPTKTKKPTTAIELDERCCCGNEESMSFSCAEVQHDDGHPQKICECDHNHDNHGAEAHGHQHLSVLPPEEMGRLRRVIAAVSMEFGVALHSIFVGIAVGLTTDRELKPLLVALVFHQAFEGMAMGSRLVDASFDIKLEIALVLVFILSAPIGMAAAIIAVSVSPDAMSGGGFVTMTAILDSFCGGILLYLAFTLLLGDFVSDLKAFTPPGAKGSRRRKVTMFIAVWFGMGIMAAVGKWL